MEPIKENWQQYYKGPKTLTVQRSNQFKWNNYDIRSKYSLFKSPRTQKERYKKKGDRTYKGNFSSFNCKMRTANEGQKNVNISPEDIEEEERKKKLSETANKLLSKIKGWSAEKKDSTECEDGKSTTVQDQSYNSVESCEKDNGVKIINNVTESTVVQENSAKGKRIAHSKNKSKIPSVKSKDSKSLGQVSATYGKSEYKVNKASLKDFQNRIQHKLINDLMQMPKGNLQNVLNDPKINPLMELKMSRLVKENKLLIAQKLRALAESKMTLNDNAKNSELLVDIDKLIDPIIETDLSVFPYELIKQMENVFQVQFDYSDGGTNPDSDSQNLSDLRNSKSDECTPGDFLHNLVDSVDCFKENYTEVNVGNFSELEGKDKYKFKDVVLNRILPISSPIINENSVGKSSFSVSEGNSSSENHNNSLSNEDLMIYECSTDEDDVNVENVLKGDKLDILKSFQEPSKSSSSNIFLGLGERKSKNKSAESGCKRKKMHANDSLKSLELKDEEKNCIKQDLSINDRPNIPLKTEKIFLNNCDTDQPIQQVPTYISQYLNQVSSDSEKCSNETTCENHQVNCFSHTSPKELISVKCQTDSSFKNVSVQTSPQSSEPNTLYGIPLPGKPPDNSTASLLEEINSIQNLLNKLNERRFMICLELFRANSTSNNIIADQISNVSFLETISNGNIYLLNLLQQLFVGVQNNPWKSNQRYSNTSMKSNRSKKKKKNLGKYCEK